MRSGVVWLVLLVGMQACHVYDPSEAGNLVPKTVDEDPSIPSLALAGTLVHYETYGDASKPVIVFLHGGPGGDFRGELRLKERYDGYALVDDYFLVYWDQRGSGLSRRHDCDAYSIEQVDHDLDALVSVVSPGRPVILVGHSWGGMYATLYIDRHPDRVAGAVLMEPGPLNHRMFDAISDALYDLDFFSEWLNDDAWDSRFLTGFVLAELGYDRAWLTYIQNSEWYRTHFYGGAKDGWYRNTGGTFEAGVKAGFRVGRVEVLARAGITRSEQLQALDLPFYATLGGSYRF